LYFIDSCVKLNIMKTKMCTVCKQAFPKTLEFFEERRSPRKSGNGVYTSLLARCKKCKYEAKQAWRKTPGGKLSRRKQARKQARKPHVKVNKACRKRLKTFLKANDLQKDRSSSKYFNFTPRQLMDHLESQFTPKMNWENYGSYWHIDHIIPLAYFKCESTEDPKIKEAWNLENLRPLEATKNLSKGSVYEGKKYYYKKG